MARAVRSIVYPLTRRGVVVAEHVRVDYDDGSKRVTWRRPGFTPDAGLAGLRTTDLPLYGADKLSALPVGSTVIVGEGEKATDALWSLDAHAVGTVTGASATPGEDALAVLLPFDVVLWPDFDEAGDQHMARVAASLIRLGGAARRLTWGGAREKGDDAADFMARGGRVDTLALYVQAATPWRLEHRPETRRRPCYETIANDGRVEAARSHLLDVVTERLGSPVEQRNSAVWWRCPFHNEKTASFKVDLKEPFFRCFGCGERGDVFTFLRLAAGADFKEALRELAPMKPRGAVMPL